MKSIFQIIFFLISSFTYSQIYTEKELRENGVKEVSILANQYDNGKITKTTNCKDFINSFGKSNLFIKYNLNGSIEYQSKTHYIDDGKTSIDTIKENNQIKYINVYQEDIKESSFSHFQIKPPHDTIIFQKWFRNKDGKDSVLINKKNNKSFVFIRNHYDQNGELTKKETFSENGKILSSKQYKYEILQNCIVHFDNDNQINQKICIENNIETTYFFKNNSGFLYGINLLSEVGGKKVKIRNDKNLISNISYFDKTGNLQSEIIFNYR